MAAIAITEGVFGHQTLAGIDVLGAEPQGQCAGIEFHIGGVRDGDDIVAAVELHGAAERAVHVVRRMPGGRRHRAVGIAHPVDDLGTGTAVEIIVVDRRAGHGVGGDRRPDGDREFRRRERCGRRCTRGRFFRRLDLGFGLRFDYGLGLRLGFAFAGGLGCGFGHVRFGFRRGLRHADRRRRDGLVLGFVGCGPGLGHFGFRDIGLVDAVGRIRQVRFRRHRRIRFPGVRFGFDLVDERGEHVGFRYRSASVPWLGDGVLITFLEDGIQRRDIGFRHVQCVRPDRDRKGVGHDANRPVPGIPAFLRRAVVLARVGTELRDAFHILEITQFLVEQGFVDRFADVFACARRRIVPPAWAGNRGPTRKRR